MSLSESDKKLPLFSSTMQMPAQLTRVAKLVFVVLCSFAEFEGSKKSPEKLR
jgi:hypothetical protein